MPNWFDVDKDGLAKLIEAKGKAFVIYELVQNAWDTNATHVEIHLEKQTGTPKARLSVHDDDPEGFQHFEHAWTLFAESVKKGDPDKRGLFNMGEKLVLALCYKASISTTKGTVTFDAKGRHHSRTKKAAGSSFEATIRMNQQEFDECCAAVRRLIPPAGVKTYFNRELLGQRKPLASFEATLPTTNSDENGVVRPTKRLTTVHVFEPLEDEVPSIYEKGIPVVETGDKWHIDVQQRVPLNMNRDNVTPAYLRQLRTLVINHMHEKVTEDEASEGWVREAMSDRDIDEDAFRDLQKKRHGDKAVIFDPSDPEANNIAASRGFTVIGGRAMSRGEHENNRRFSATLPAGRVTPSPKPFSPDGDPLKMMDKSDWTDDIRNVVRFTQDFAQIMMGITIYVRIARDRGWGFNACYGDRELTLNYSKLGKATFANGIGHRMRRLLIHELAHEYASNHLSDEYYEACCKVGSLMVQYALDNPDLFR